ncbi:MAG: 2-phosphosulfolactate phosphatase [Myxococcota bacterium]
MNRTPSPTRQTPFDVRLEWGLIGVQALQDCPTFIIVDVLSFSTTVCTACDDGIPVYPYPSHGHGAANYAKQVEATLAGRRGSAISLSPSTMRKGMGAIVLPSPNGSTIAFEADGQGQVLLGCLRNRTAVARRAVELGGPFALIPAGERWPDGSLRPAFEDLIGAGAIAEMLPGRRSPEAEAAVASFKVAEPRLVDALTTCSSGTELTERGFTADVMHAARIDVSMAAPLLSNRAFRAGEDSGPNADVRK